MKCRVCRGPAIIDLRRHNANFCAEHFTKFCRDQVAKAIKDHAMMQPGDRVLVAVSGGKDSLAIWDILSTLGYEVDGLYVGLGIGDYSETSGDYARQFAEARSLRLIEIDVRNEYGFDVPNGSRAVKRAPCSACGMSKRHLFDRAALEGKYDVLVTGHNLDDEAAVLFGNTLHWQTEYLGRQEPVLEARPGFPRKVKPLIRLSEREMAAFCVVSGIDYIIEECPMAVGNRHIAYKEALNLIEARSPGAKQDFYHGFLARAADRFKPEVEEARGDLLPCTSCGSPTPTEVCAFCRMIDRATAPQPIYFTDRNTVRKRKGKKIDADKAPSHAE